MARADAEGFGKGKGIPSIAFRFYAAASCRTTTPPRPRSPRSSGKQQLQFLVEQGFVLCRIRGSHHFLERGDERTTVPVHGNRPLKTGTLRSILRNFRLTPTEFAQRWTG